MVIVESVLQYEYMKDLHGELIFICGLFPSITSSLSTYLYQHAIATSFEMVCCFLLDLEWFSIHVNLFSLGILVTATMIKRRMPLLQNVLQTKSERDKGAAVQITNIVIVGSI